VLAVNANRDKVGKMEISVIGAGYVGLTTAACLAEIGHHVLCADCDMEKLNSLKAGQLPFYEPHLDDLVKRNVASGRLEFTIPADAIEKSEAIFICVGTPPLENGEADLSAIESVARLIMSTARGYRVVIEKSTVPVQTAKRLWKHLSIYNANGLSFDVVSNPEFLREGSAVEDFFHPDRVVIGAESPRAIALMKEIYAPVLGTRSTCAVHAQCPGTAQPKLILTDTSSAELVKHASNSFLAMKISFINLIADACEAAGADIEKVAEGIGSDKRIGQAFLSPGIGFGGFCFPKDLQAFVRIGEKLGCDFSLLREVEKINVRRTEQFVAKIRKELWVLRGKTLAVWGLAFKPNTDDVRFAPALAIIRRLLSEGAKIRAYDPEAMQKARRDLPEISYCESSYQAAEGADAILVLTEWSEFRMINWTRLGELVSHRLIIDGRNLLSADEVLANGFQYVGVGRAAEPVPSSGEPKRLGELADVSMRSHSLPLAADAVPAAT
jgi:UDPglucose 6-dehydrogenase